MSKKTEKLAAKALKVADQAARDIQDAADKVAASEAADRNAALSSPADNAMERAFARGELPDKDRRSLGFPPVGLEPQPPTDNDHVLPGSERFPESVTAEAPDGSLLTFVASDPPPTGVRSPASPDIDVAARASVFDRVPGTPIPTPVPAPRPETERERVVRVAVVDGVATELPTIPVSVETRGPLVPLVSLSEVHPSTVEAAVVLQRIPNDQIHGVFEDADGTKRDALGHPFA